MDNFSPSPLIIINYIWKLIGGLEKTKKYLIRVLKMYPFFEKSLKKCKIKKRIKYFCFLMTTTPKS